MRNLVGRSKTGWMQQNGTVPATTLNTPFTLGHGNHVSGHHCQTSAKRDWRETTQGDGVLKRDCRGCRARTLNCQKFYHGSHSADEERSKTGFTQQNVAVPNRP